ncbi:hypothetical protein JKP88DRAFT_319856 [Tribonema minus]|uniref:Glucosylceramidase n=1 Tax=Tribonema minus TaxID=303371 RepID=A0A835YZ36_9STRA|nr:hypothetical protein JKP88DRAFT_319856 [Tribonema minus]
MSDLPHASSDKEHQHPDHEPLEQHHLLDHNQWDRAQIEALRKAQAASPDPSIPDPCWARNLADPLPDVQTTHRPARPGVLESLKLLPIGYRVGRYLRRERAAGRDPVFDLSGPFMSPPDPGPYAGVPLGGLGGGSIGRGFRGEFRRWTIFPGRTAQRTVHADQFSLRVAPAAAIDGENAAAGAGGVHARVLSVDAAADAPPALRSWRWGADPARVTSCALYPRSWLVYDECVPGLQATCRAVSPVLPGEYRESSLPAAAFVWTLRSTAQHAVTASLMFTYQSGDGGANDCADGHTNRAFSLEGGGVRGVELRYVHRTQRVYTPGEEHEPAGGWGARGGCCSSSGGGEARSSSASCDGCPYVGSPGAHSDDEDPAWSDRMGPMPLQAAFEDPVTLAPGETRELVFALAWDAPLARFGAGAALPRRYTRFFGRGGRAAPALAAHALAACARWEEAIDAWQQPVLRDAALPRYYRYTLFNELYFLSEGGTLWLDACDGRANAQQQTPPLGGAGGTPPHPPAPLIDPQASPLWGPPREGGLGPVEAASPASNGTSGGGSSFLQMTTPLLKPGVARSAEPWYGGLRGGGERGGTGGTAHSWRGPGLPASEAETAADAGCGGDAAVIGQLLYLEGLEYLMYNTYDVHFYASFALARLWPALEMSLQRDVALSVFRSDRARRTLLGDGSARPRKVRGAVPHDVGTPSEMPFLKANAYVFQDVSRWKDLAPKFALQVCRDYAVTDSTEFLQAVWPAAVEVMRVAEAWDTDDDGLIENQGFPDQTYDIWTATGPSAYTGGLWVAALAAMGSMAAALGDDGAQERYQGMFEKAKSAYDERLWNGSYHDYDDGGAAHSDSIMADQMAGQWYARCCGVSPPVDPPKARSSLLEVLAHNVRHYAIMTAKERTPRRQQQSSQSEGYSIGAVNGMRPGGRRLSRARSVDDTCLQSREVWTGVTYACASAMLLEAAAVLKDPQAGPDHTAIARELICGGFETARGVHDGGWNAFGYWFQTPEAWEANGNYRSLAYMRPLAIWGVQYALEQEPLLREVLASGQRAPAAAPLHETVTL